MTKAGVVIDMGGTRIKIGIVREHQLIDTRVVDGESHTDLETRLDALAVDINILLDKNQCIAGGIGLAFPGIVDASNKKILSDYVKYPGAKELNLSHWAAHHWNVPFVAENDARAALLGEWKYGAGQDAHDVVLVTLGTGFGSAVLIDGRLLRGKNHLAGNLGGHMTINMHGRICNCGNIGCLETESASWALDYHIRKNPSYSNSILKESPAFSFDILFSSYEKGDALANYICEHCLKAWSLGIINLIHAYDPEKIIMGGGIMHRAGIIIPYIEDMICKYSWAKSNPPQIVPAMHLEFAGLLGMYHLLRECMQACNEEVF